MRHLLNGGGIVAGGGGGGRDLQNKAWSLNAGKLLTGEGTFLTLQQLTSIASESLYFQAQLVHFISCWLQTLAK